ncbi:hypothetical protein ACJX0J_005521 [Zea mays]
MYIIKKKKNKEWLNDLMGRAGPIDEVGLDAVPFDEEWSTCLWLRLLLSIILLCQELKHHIFFLNISIFLILKQKRRMHGRQAHHGDGGGVRTWMHITNNEHKIIVRQVRTVWIHASSATHLGGSG